MPTFTFKPSAKAFPNAKPEVDFRTIEVTMSESGVFMVNGKPLSPETHRHAVAFAIKQRLANSFVSAATAKNESGGLLPESERLIQWGALFDKVLAKITDPKASPDWQAVFVAGERAESDPFGAEVRRIAVAQLGEVAKAKGKTLPKRDTDEYKNLLAKFTESRRDAIEAEAKRRLAAVADIDIEDDFDLDDIK